MSDKTRMTSRIPCTPEVQHFMKEYANGLGVTYDEALRFLVRDIHDTGKDPLIAGREQRDALTAWRKGKSVMAKGTDFG
jgi:hypothetical protein